MRQLEDSLLDALSNVQGTVLESESVISTLEKLKTEASKITEEMKVKAAEAIAASIEGQPTRSYIIPDSLDKDVSIKISDELGKI